MIHGGLLRDERRRCRQDAGEPSRPACPLSSIVSQRARILA
ncbi:MAG: hypothetical protein AVDCRST_MAG87-1660 [uncultured Thermomicrobiales bacterium]|uniref:Uncharacterized protein n=1 Tax=uncultured Thermomicrobiales bacterium TaxID=1645740 RepID=A0A6J4UXK8_9BACT|nr:MAG: hypothetical protein AVDCRST_MAG87-1660 [uncultured Thermomicrobiales bacterium]